MNSEATITRFAPSPTGRLHLGNARTALFNFLFARAGAGRFLLRIEDTDAERGAEEHVGALVADLEWLGLRWDEEPRRQSERTAIYAKYFARLESAGQAYPCYCTEEELHLARKAQLAAGRPPRYPGTCAKLGPDERRAKAAEGRTASLRFRVPAGRDVVYSDLVRGEQRFPADTLGDFVIRRSDGSPAFLFANALDDALLGITHVLRGEDHVANTPRQLLLLEALELKPPRYGHLPLLVGADGRPLSKRHGAASLEALGGQGYLPLAVMNYLARLGHHYEDDALMDAKALSRGFDPAHLGRAPAHFDRAQLDHWQRLAVTAQDDGAFLAWAGDALERVPAERREAFARAVRPNCLFAADVRFWAEALFGPAPRLEGDAARAIEEAGPAFFDAAARAVGKAGADPGAIRQATGAKGKALFMPLRAALTGTLHGPDMHSLLALLGPEKIRERLNAWAKD